MIFVTGAAGFIGRHVIRELVTRGLPCRALLSRPNPDFTALFPDIETVVGDLLDPETLDRGLAGAGAVLHLASKNIDHDGSGFERVNVEGSRRLAERSAKAGVERLVYISSVGVYGHGAHRDTDESAPLAPDTPFSRSKVAAEGLLLDAHRRGDFATVILRHRFVHGEGDRSVVPRLLGAARKYPFWISGGRALMSFVWAPDLARVAVKMVRGEVAADADEPVYHVTDGQRTTYRQVITTLCGHLGRRPPRISIPLALLYWPIRLREKLLGIDPEASSASITSIRLELVAQDNHFSNAKLVRALGSEAAFTPFSVGFLHDAETYPRVE